MPEVTQNEASKKRHPGRPASGEDLVQVSVVLRRDQVARLKDFAALGHAAPGFGSVSAILRSLIDSTFPRK